MTPQDGQRDGSTAAGRLRSALTSHPGYKLSALFFATVLWVVASAEETAERFVPVRFAPALAGELVLDEQPELRALVSGPARELLKLYDTPPILRREITGAAPGEMRLKVEPSDVILPPGVDALVRDVQPRTLVLRIARGPRGVPARAAGP